MISPSRPRHSCIAEAEFVDKNWFLLGVSLPIPLHGTATHHLEIVLAIACRVVGVESRGCIPIPSWPEIGIISQHWQMGEQLCCNVCKSLDTVFWQSVKNNPEDA